MMNRRELFTGSMSTCAATPKHGAAALIPNITVRNQENVAGKFYDDFVKGKQVIINMMYANCEGACPMITSRLVEVHKALSGRMGKDLFMCSLTLKPQEDSPASLKEFAQMHRALLPGWQFLTADAFDMETLRFALFRHDHIKLDLDSETHTAKLRIINDNINRWGHVAPMAELATVLQHISWADAPKSFEERFKENRKLQESIDKEVKLYGYRKVV